MTDTTDIKALREIFEILNEYGYDPGGDGEVVNVHNVAKTVRMILEQHCESSKMLEAERQRADEEELDAEIGSQLSERLARQLNERDAEITDLKNKHKEYRWEDPLEHPAIIALRNGDIFNPDVLSAVDAMAREIQIHRNYKRFDYREDADIEENYNTGKVDELNKRLKIAGGRNLKISIENSRLHTELADLKAKLANPVVLPELLSASIHDPFTDGEKAVWQTCIKHCTSRINKAGFTVKEL